MIIWHNDAFKNEDDFSFSLTDRVRFGDGIFDTMLCVDGQIIAFNDHISRFYNHAELMHLPVPYAEDDLLCASRQLVRTNALQNSHCIINLLLSRGDAPRGLMPPPDPDSNLIIRATQAPANYPDVHAVISKTTRRNEGSPLSRIKSFNYGDNILALIEAKERGATEAILLNNQGHVACASSANIYLFHENKLLTPPLSDGAMDGIIRKKLLETKRATEKSLTRNDLINANSLYLSSSIRGLYPISTLEGKTLTLANSPIDPHFHLKL